MDKQMGWEETRSVQSSDSVWLDCRLLKQSVPVLTSFFLLPLLWKPLLWITTNSRGCRSFHNMKIIHSLWFHSFEAKRRETNAKKAAFDYFSWAFVCFLLKSSITRLRNPRTMDACHYHDLISVYGCIVSSYLSNNDDVHVFSFVWS